MNRRILVIDDNHAIHEDFRKILTTPAGAAEYTDLSAEVFGEVSLKREGPGFEVDSAFQGQEGLERVRQALASARPYAMGFVDVRMPPGWDGIETITRLWQFDPEIQIVICTAYADRSWDEITARLGGSDKLVILKKPFDVIEVLQLANALTRKWSLAQESKRHLRELDEKIEERTRELRESETRYRSLFENMLEGFAYCRMQFEDDRPVDFVYLEVNKAFEKLTGLKNVVGKKLSEVLPGLAQSHPEILEKYGKVALTGQPERFEIHLEQLRAWLAISVYSPSKGHFVAVFDNITKRKEADLRLSAFAKLDHNLSAAKTAKEAARTIVDVADQLLGWDACLCDLYSGAENIVSHVLSVDLVNSQRTECDATALNFHPPSPLAKRAIEEGGQLVLRERQDAPSPGLVPFGDVSRPSASILYVPIRNGPLPIGVLSIQSYAPNAYDLHDLEALQALADRCGGAMERIRTEESLRQTQEQLRQSQKLEAIGQLAGGVAHDFNNLLAVIRGNADLVRMGDHGFSDEVTGCLNQITAASDRAANLTRQLLTFSRKQMMQSQPVDLNDVIVNLTKMLKRIIGEDIDLQCHYSSGLPMVQADVGMLEQVLVNLVVNARDAMPDGGQLLITTEQLTFETGGDPSHPEARPGSFVCVTVKDTGTGISAQNLPRIFDPFFTTKDVGKGTGLGLATVYGIVKQHQGWIEVSSQVGTGSAFKIFLAAVECPRRASNDRAPQAEPSRGKETVLLVEDEESVRSVTRLFLQRYGYRVLEAGSGPEALKVWEAAAPEVDLLLTDVVMPEGITGRQLAENLRAKKASLKIIFQSGYSGEVLSKNSEFLRQTNSYFLHKPCAPQDLLSAVRRCLDGLPAQREEVPLSA